MSIQSKARRDARKRKTQHERPARGGAAPIEPVTPRTLIDCSEEAPPAVRRTRDVSTLTISP